MRIDSSGNVDLYQGNNLTWRYAAGSTIRGSMSIDSADNITFSNGSSNTERMRIDTSGNLLIGGTGNTFSAKVAIAGALTVGDGQPSTSIYFDDSTTSTSRYRLTNSLIVEGDFAIMKYNGSSWDDALYIDENRKIGIGTDNPYTPLNIRTSNSLGSTFTGSTRGEGVTVEQSSYTADNYVSLIEAPYAANAAPAARIGVKFNGSGSWLTLGTSNNYATGITNATMVINPNGDVTIDGHVTISDGVYIGGTATGNHLDDYEEGTWTPVLNGSPTHSASNQYYVKIGNLVHVGAYIYSVSDYTSATDFTISGLPYATNNARGVGSVMYRDINNSTITQLNSYVSSNSSTLYFYASQNNGGTWNPLEYADGDGGLIDIIFNITYLVS